MRRWLSATGDRIAVRVPAKINLFLAVRGLRADGYHELSTVFQTLSLYDTVTARLAGPPGRSEHPAARRSMTLEVGCDVREVPRGSDNLALRAARLLGETTSVLAADDSADEADQVAGNSDAPAGEAGEPDRRPTLSVAAGEWVPRSGARTIIELRKAIPVAAGLAGGSADAAGALLALNELWGCDLDTPELRELAAELGSDVAFCTVGGTALATGRGEAMAQVLCRGRFHWVVGLDAAQLSTAEVYRAWDTHGAPSETEPDAVLAALVAGDVEALGAALHNELQPAARRLRPEIADRQQALMDAGALATVVSGSGPTVLGLARDAGHAHQLAEAVAERFHRVHVASSPAGGPEPVSGRH